MTTQLWGQGRRPAGKGVSPHAGRALLVCFVSGSRPAAPARGCRGCTFSILWLKLLEALFSALLGSAAEHTSDAAGNRRGSRLQQFAEHGVLRTETHYHTWGCHSGTPPAAAGVPRIGECGVGVGGCRGRPAWGREEPEVLSKADLGTHPNGRTARAPAV